MRRSHSFGLLLALFSHGALAVEVPALVTGKKHGDRETAGRDRAVEGRWAVVGIISSGNDGVNKGFGIAVVKNLSTNRTYTLSIGDSLPSDFEGFVLESVIGRRVTVSNGHSQTVLPFAEASLDESEGQSRTARFIDNYYRGLGQMPAAGQMLGSEGEGSVVGGSQLQRFTSWKDDNARSRFELYRTDKMYGDGEADSDPDGGEFVVNYDNFEPEAQGGYDGSSGGSGEVPERTREPIGEALRRYDELRERESAADSDEVPAGAGADAETMGPVHGELMNEAMSDNLLGE